MFSHEQMSSQRVRRINVSLSLFTLSLELQLILSSKIEKRGQQLVQKFYLKTGKQEIACRDKVLKKLADWLGIFDIRKDV